jgi:hypothetical protein
VKLQPEGKPKNKALVNKTVDPVAAGKRQEANSRSAVQLAWRENLGGMPPFLYLSVPIRAERSLNFSAPPFEIPMILSGEPNLPDDLGMGFIGILPISKGEGYPAVVQNWRNDSAQPIFPKGMYNVALSKIGMGIKIGFKIARCSHPI